jgi:hypothetical protein
MTEIQYKTKLNPINITKIVYIIVMSLPETPNKSSNPTVVTVVIVAKRHFIKEASGNKNLYPTLTANTKATVIKIALKSFLNKSFALGFISVL